MKGHTLFFVTQEEYYSFMRWILQKGYVLITEGKIPRLYCARSPYYGYYEPYSGLYATSGYRLVRFNRRIRDNDPAMYFAKPEDITTFGLQKMHLNSIEEVYKYRKELGHYER